MYKDVPLTKFKRTITRYIIFKKRWSEERWFAELLAFEETGLALNFEAMRDWVCERYANTQSKHYRLRRMPSLGRLSKTAIADAFMEANISRTELISSLADKHLRNIMIRHEYLQYRLEWSNKALYEMLVQRYGVSYDQIKRIIKPIKDKL